MQALFVAVQISGWIITPSIVKVCVRLWSHVEMLKTCIFASENICHEIFQYFCVVFERFEKNVFEQVLGTLFSQRGNAFVGPTDNCLKWLCIRQCLCIRQNSCSVYKELHSCTNPC